MSVDFFSMYSKINFNDDKILELKTIIIKVFFKTVVYSIISVFEEALYNHYSLSMYFLGG